jgi:hypothetical protein
MDEQRRVLRPLYRRKEFLFISVLVLLVAFLLLSSRMTGRPPQVDSITPEIGFPKDVMVITGHYFGQQRNNGEVVIAGYAPVSSDYLEWNDTRISLRIPEDASSGMVRVVTKNGRSRGLLFTNKDQVPVVLSGPGRPGAPQITSLEPANGPVGTAVTVSGLNFGLQQGASRVLFTWVSGDESRGYREVDASSLTPALGYDLDYGAWGDREIQVRIPDGASSGSVVVATEKGHSNAAYIEVEGAAGTKLFPEKRTYAVQYAIEVGSPVVEGDHNGLYLWVPQPVQAPEQREIQLVSEEPAPLYSDVGGVKLVFLEDLQPGANYTVTQNLMVDRYAVETRIDINKVPQTYDTGRRLYKRYTAADPLVASDREDVVKLARSVVGSERNPYRKARALYRYLIDRLEPDPSLQETDPLKSIETRKATSYHYALLFCALARSQGVPARPVAGYLIDKDLKSSRHYWAEFYVETVGWIPVDPFLGEGKIRQPLPADQTPLGYYFGNLDFGRLAFSKGLIEVSQMDPSGRTIQRADIPSLQTLHEQAEGGLVGYTAIWSDLRVLGVY